MGKSWKNPSKVANANKKGAVISKLAREIQVAAKLGGADPSMNARLRMAIDAAKKESVPADTIERATKKGAGLLDDGTVMEEPVYEGYGPHGVGVLVECLSDNLNRTASEMRLLFKSGGGNMGESNSVGWMFDRVCLLEGKKAGEFDPEEEAIEAGANEVEKSENGYSFYGAMSDLDSIRKALTARGWTLTTAEPAYKAKNITELNETQMNEVLEFLGEIDEHDDTHRVYATIKSN